MIAKRTRLIAAFHTTAAAMAMESACARLGAPGRLIPVPRAITAGCGMCWAAPPEARDALEELAVKKRLDVDGVYAIII